MPEVEKRLAQRTVRLADVAKAAGVSQGTASNVFSRPHLVREEVRDRVQETAKSLGYRGPDLRGRLLRAGKVNAIGVAATEPLSYFFAYQMRAAEDVRCRALRNARRLSNVC